MCPARPCVWMHCWHQKVRIEKARDGDQYGDVEVDVNKSREVYRRPEFMMRHVTPKRSAYRVGAPDGGNL